jgi:hypothetical protein
LKYKQNIINQEGKEVMGKDTVARRKKVLPKSSNVAQDK